MNKITFKDLSDTKIESLIIKQRKEELERGKALLSTLVKLNLAYSEKYLLENDLAKAEKFIKLSFEFLHQSFDEAIMVEDAVLRRNILHSIQLQQYKLVEQFVRIKLSFKNTITLDLFKDIYAELEMLIVTRLFGKPMKQYLYFEILNSLNIYIRDNKISVGDDDKVIDLIDSELIEHQALEDQEHITLDWLKVRLYRQLVRQERRNAHHDIEAAKRVASYRKSSANILLHLNEEEDYFRDYLDGLLYDVLATKTKKKWFKAFEVCALETEELVSKNIINNDTANRIYLRCFVKAVELNNRIDLKVEYLKQVLYFSEISKSPQYYFFQPLFHLLDLFKELNKHSDLLSLKKYIQDNTIDSGPRRFAFKDESYNTVKDLYSSVIRLINGEDPFIANPIFQSLNHLRNVDVIVKDKDFIKLLQRALAIEINNSGIMVGLSAASEEYEENDNELVALEKLLNNEESSKIEVKLSMDDFAMKERILKTITAFANDEGGHIVIGLIEKKYFAKQFPPEDINKYKEFASGFILIGYKNSDIARTKLATMIRERSSLEGKSIDQIYTFNILRVGGKSVPIIKVKPYAITHKRLLLFDDIPYRRFDNQTMKMSFIEASARIAEIYEGLPKNLKK